MVRASMDEANFQDTVRCHAANVAESVIVIDSSDAWRNDSLQTEYGYVLGLREEPQDKTDR